ASNTMWRIDLDTRSKSPRRLPECPAATGVAPRGVAPSRGGSGSEMSCNDRNAGAVRPWRQLTRVLVVAGATVAGTSAAWLVGQALPAEAGPAGADPTAVQQDPAGQGAPVEQGLPELVPGDEQLP